MDLWETKSKVRPKKIRPEPDILLDNNITATSRGTSLPIPAYRTMNFWLPP